MKGFDYDSTRRDPAFRAVMKTAARVKAGCDKAFCVKCPYHRPGQDALVVCYTEKLADEMILEGLIDYEAANRL